MKVTKSMRAVPFPTPAGDDGPQLTSSGLTWEPVIWMGRGATIATMRMRMRRKKHRKPMMYSRRLWRTKGIVLESVKIGQYFADL
jgi:hypothetical protein